MIKRMILVVLAGALALAVAILAYRGCLSGSWRGIGLLGLGRSASSRIADHEAELATLGVVDEALILFQESPPLVPDGIETVTALAVGADGRIYVGGGRTLVVLTPQGEEIRRMEVAAEMTCLAASESGKLYVGFVSAVHVYDAQGRRTASFAEIRPDAIITSLAAAGDDVFVADANSRTVLQFSPNGVLKRMIDGRQGQADDQGFIVPSPYFDVMLGQGRTLWIVNPGRRRLEEYSFDGERIAFWPEKSGMAVTDFCGCCNPTHVAKLGDGSVVTSEKGLVRVKTYTTRGGFIGVVAAPAAFGNQQVISDLAVDAQGRVLVANPTRAAIRVFERK